MIKKIKSSFNKAKKLVAVGLISLALSSADVKSQWTYALPMPPLLPKNFEIDGERTIRNYFKRKKISFKTNRPFSFRTENRIFFLEPDFQLRNGLIIEYWSPEDKVNSEIIKRDYEIFNQELHMIAGDLRRLWLPDWQRHEIFSNYLIQRGIIYERSTETPIPDSFKTIITISTINYIIPKPSVFLDKKELYEKYKQTEGKVYYIETKETEDKISIEQELEKILKEATKDLTLTENQTEEIISIYLNQKKIDYKINPTFKTNDIIIRPNFLIETSKSKLPIAIEYWGGERKYQEIEERVYQKYKKAGGKVYIIKSGNREEILNDLEKIVNDIFPQPVDSLKSTTESTIKPK